jgi:hypothetical protein
MAAKSNVQQSSPTVMSEVELQASLMSFSDRTASILIDSLDEFDSRGPTLEARKFVMSDISYTLSAAYTIAAEQNPQVALLDLTVVITMGRSIYEDLIRSKYGEQVDPVIKGFKTLENDIWRTASQVLTTEQQQELRGHIQRWRSNNPDLLVYNYVRFSDFDAERRNSTLVGRSKGGGLFKSVRQVTEEVEETRMLAERAMFLATRLPLLAGHFADVWTSQVMVNPEIKQVVDDLDQLTDLTEQLVEVTDSLPLQIMGEQRLIVDGVMKDVNDLSQGTVDNVMSRVSAERSEAIDQLMTQLAEQRTEIFRELSSEQQQLGELTGAFQQALEEGNSLVSALDQLAVRLGLDQPADPGAPPFDIRDYRDTLSEASTAVGELTRLVETTDRLVASDSVEQIAPQLIGVLDRIKSESKELVRYIFIFGVLLVLIWIVGYVAARLLVVYLSKKFDHRV